VHALGTWEHLEGVQSGLDCFWQSLCAGRSDPMGRSNRPRQAVLPSWAASKCLFFDMHFQVAFQALVQGECALAQRSLHMCGGALV
jgi:hypothetical protein